MTWKYSSLFMIEGMVTLTRIETQRVHRWSDKLFCLCFLAFDFCRFCVVIRVFSSPLQRPMTSDLEGFSIPDVIHYIYFPILFFWERASISIWMFSAKQGHYWYHFYNVFGMTRSLTGDWTRDIPHSKPALYH